MALAAVRKVLSKLRQEQATDRMLVRARERTAADGSLTGKRVLVTGSTRGIGRALAEAFVQQGASVVVHGRTDDAAHELADRLGARSGPGVSVVGIGADLSVPGSGTTLVERAITALGGLDLVVNNAGVHDPELKPLWETSSEEMASVMRVNVLAAFEVSAAAMAHMVGTGVAGRIVNLSTTAVGKHDVTSGGIASYGISKIALEGLARFLAAEGEAHGITVTTVRPDAVDTAMVAPFYSLDRRLRMLPPDSLVPPVLHLAAAPSEDVHGRMFDQQELLEMLGGSTQAGDRTS